MPKSEVAVAEASPTSIPYSAGAMHNGGNKELKFKFMSTKMYLLRW